MTAKCGMRRGAATGACAHRPGERSGYQHSSSACQALIQIKDRRRRIAEILPVQSRSPRDGQTIPSRFKEGPCNHAALARNPIYRGSSDVHRQTRTLGWQRPGWQCVSIEVAADVGGCETALLRFNCFDFVKSYVYGPENPDLHIAAPAMLGGAERTSSGMGQLYRMDPVTDGNPIGWTVRTLATLLPAMLERAGYQAIATRTNLAVVRRVPT